MSKKRNMAYLKNKKSDIISALGCFLLSMLVLCGSILCNGPFDKTSLHKTEAAITNIEYHSVHKGPYWISFTADGNAYYVRTDILGASKNDILQALENNQENKLTIYYTNMPELHLSTYMYWGARRVACIESNSEQIVSLDDFNKSNQPYMWIGVIVSVIIFIVVIFKVRNIITYICKHRKKKSKRHNLT